jgi:hypothetical protein
VAHDDLRTFVCGRAEGDTDTNVSTDERKNGGSN